MKYSGYILIISLATLFGCNKIESLGTVDVNGDIEKDFNVSITSSDPSTFTDTFNIEAGSNSHIAKYLSQIKSYTVSKVTYRIANYSGAQGVTLTGHIKFGSISYDLTNVDLKTLSDNATVTTIPFDKVSLDAIAADFKDGNSVAGTIDGTVSDKPVSFTVAVVVSAVVNVNVIN